MFVFQGVIDGTMLTPVYCTNISESTSRQMERGCKVLFQVTLLP